jgi:mannose-1-phosphate guanylyltransferase
VKAVVLVGGEGTRLRPLTYITVKAMVPVLNKPFIEYIIRHLNHHNIRDIVLAIGYKPDSITEYFTNDKQIEARLIYSIETRPMGTAGALKNAERHIDGTVLAMNGDIFSDIDYTDMIRFHRKKGAKVTIALTPVEDPTRFGVVETDGNQRVTRFVEKPRREEVTNKMINAGVYIIEKEVLKRIPESQHCMFENAIFPALVTDQEHVYGYVTDAYWMDMGTPEKYLQLNGDLLCGKSSQVDFRKTKISIDKQSSIHPQSKLAGPLLIDRNCKIGAGVELKGPVVIGEECEIGDNAFIENSVIWQNVTIGRKAALKDTIVATGSRIDDNEAITGAIIARTVK